MGTKYCPKCGTKINEGDRFCSKCGIPIENNNMQNNIDEDILIEESLNQPNKSLRISKILLGIFVLTVLFFIGKSFFLSYDSSEKSFSTTEQLIKLEGKWHDSTGIMTGYKDVYILLRKKGDVVVGKDDKSLIEMKLTPFGSNNYGGSVILLGVEDYFEVHFYEEENKLVFFSTLTKSSWYLKKIK